MIRISNQQLPAIVSFRFVLETHETIRIRDELEERDEDEGVDEMNDVLDDENGWRQCQRWLAKSGDLDKPHSSRRKCELCSQKFII